MRRGSLMVAGVIAILACWPSRADTVKQLEQQRQANAARKRSIRRQLIATKSEQQRLLGQLSASESQLRSARTQLRAAESQLGATRAKLRETRAKHAETKRELEETKDAFAARLKVLCKRGRGSYLAVVMDAEDFSQFSRRAFIAQKILDYDATLLETIQAKQEELAEQQAQLEVEEQREASQRTDVLTRAAVVERQTARVRADKAEVDDERRSLQAQLDQLERESREITAMLRRLARGGVAYKGAPQWTGRYHFPVPGGRLGSGFGMRMHPILRRVRMHEGVDISARTGTPIQAAETGLVVYTGRQRGYGKLVIVDHGGGVSTLYAHCSALLVSRGQMVRRGQTIARVGSTGLSTGPHCHFELRIRGQPVNPLR